MAKQAKKPASKKAAPKKTATAKANSAPEKKQEEVEEVESVETTKDPATDAPETQAPASEKKAEAIEVEDAKEVTPSKQKLRKCLVLRDHKCRIGGQPYSVKKDEEISLPSGVAMLLQRARVVVIK